MLILIVEAQSAISEATRNELEHNHHRVFIVRNQSEAMACMRSYSISLALVELSIPDVRSFGPSLSVLQRIPEVWAIVPNEVCNDHFYVGQSLGVKRVLSRIALKKALADGGYTGNGAMVQVPVSTHDYNPINDGHTGDVEDP